MNFQNDKELWLPGKTSNNSSREKYNEETQNRKDVGYKSDIGIELAYQIIRQVGDQFCDLIHQEKKVLDEYKQRGSYLGFEISRTCKKFEMFS